MMNKKGQARRGKRERESKRETRDKERSWYTANVLTTEGKRVIQAWL